MADDSPGGVRRSRAQQKAQTRRRLQDATWDLLRDRSFDSLTVDDIAAAAGVSRRTFFNHFPTKGEALLPDRLVVFAPAAEEFASGGPTGDLIADLEGLLLASLRAVDRSAADAERAELLAAVMYTDVEVAAAFVVSHAIFEVEIGDLVYRRLSTDSGLDDAERRRRAYLCAMTMTAVLRSSWMEWLGGGDDGFVTTGFGALRALFGR